MEADMLVEVPRAVVIGASPLSDVEENVDNDQALDCSCVYRSAIDSPSEADMVTSRQSCAAPSYWRDVSDAASAPASRRRCESCDSDVSVTSLPASSASDDDIDSSLCKVAADNWMSFTPETDRGVRRSGVSVKTRHPALSRAVACSVRRAAQSPPTPVGFSIADILRPDFGKPAVPDNGQRQDVSIGTSRRCSPSYHQSALPTTVRRSLMHPYTAAAFCAAAVAAAAASVHRPNIRQHSSSANELASDANKVERLTPSRHSYDVNYQLVNNNNNTKLRSSYSYDDKEVGSALGTDAVRQKTGSEAPAAVRRTRDTAALSSRHKTAPGAGRMHQSSGRQPSPSARQPTSKSSAAAADRETSDDQGGVKQQAGSTKSSGALAPLPWPAWVYCTRYSDRPSSGPRTRKPKKAEQLAIDEKRPRTAFTAAQLDRLKREFEDSKYLTEERRQSLANELALNESQIKIWFQNKRAKMKKASGVRNQLALQLMAQGLYNHTSNGQR